METFKLGDRVKVIGKNAKGTIAFIGKTHLSDGIMYGIAMDKPKGRCSGEIGNVRYFVCPKDHGVFVRACQLQMDYSNSSDYSEDYTGDVIPRPVYPNYLKFSSKLNFRKSKYHSKSKENVSKVKSSLKQGVRNKQQSDYNRCFQNSSPGKFSKDPRLKIKKNRHLSRKQGDKRASDDENFLIQKIMAEKINTQTHQIHSIHLYLKKLETYVRWSRGIGSKENHIKKHLNIAIDGVIRNMEEIVGDGEVKIDYDHRKGDVGMEKENDVLLQCISDLEKKNATLIECMTKIRGLLLNSYKLRSRGKFKSDVHRNNTSERHSPFVNRCKPHSSKNPEANSTSKLLSENQHLDGILKTSDQGERETESIKRYLESLNIASKNETSTRSLYLKKEKGLNESPKRGPQHLSKVVCVKNYLKSKNNDITELTKDLNGICVEKCIEKCEERDSSKPNIIYEDPKLPKSRESETRSPVNEKVSYQPYDNSKIKYKIEMKKTQAYVSEKRLNREQITSNKNTDFTENEKDPAKELSEFISNMMTNVTFNEQKELAPEDPTQELCEFISNVTSNMTSNGQNEKVPKDSPSFKKQNMCPLTTAGKCYSYPDSDKFEKVSNSSHKSKSENTLKLRKSVRTSHLNRSRLLKKRMNGKQTMKYRKQ